MKKIILQAKMFIGKFLAKEDGISAIEYALIAAGIALVVATGIGPIGSTLTSVFTRVNSAI